MKHRGTIYILDTTSLILYRVPYRCLCVSCRHILGEVHDPIAKSIIQGFVDAGQLIIDEPDEAYIKRAREIAEKTGDLTKLSEADIHVVALAIKYRDMGYNVNVVTDDFSIQNILRMLGIKYIKYFREIKKVIKWVIKCEKCGKIYPPNYKGQTCAVCGGRLVRRRKR